VAEMKIIYEREQGSLHGFREGSGLVREGSVASFGSKRSKKKDSKGDESSSVEGSTRGSSVESLKDRKARKRAQDKMRREAKKQKKKAARGGEHKLHEQITCRY
jgi:hypothetical protein